MHRAFVLFVSLLFTGICVADTWTVDDDGKADFDNIQAALDAASDGDEIIVMPGSYTSSQEGHVVNMLGKEVLLLGAGGQEVTIIDGQGLRRGIACFNGETNKTVIDGFTITNGYAKQFDYNGNNEVNFWEDSGAGMMNYQSDVTLDNCSFFGNTTISEAAGMFNYNSNPVLTNCNFESNSAFSGSGMYNKDSSPTLIGCTFINNTADYGGGIYNFSSEPTLTNCEFTNNTAYNSGGGMANYFDSIPWLDSCEFVNNIADIGGGLVNYSSNPTFDGCLFENNIAYSGGGGLANFNSSNPVMRSCEFGSNTAFGLGGGMYNHYSNPALSDGCAFINNTSFDAGGGMRNYRSSPILTDCSFTDNAAATYAGGIDNHESSSPTLDGCNFTNNTAEYGGGIANYYDSSPTLESCIFNSNASVFGGALYNQSSSSPIVKSCVMIGNKAPLGAGIYARFASSVYFVDTNFCDSLYFSDADITLPTGSVVGSSIHLAAESVCKVAGSIIPSATGSITFEIDDLGTSSSLRADTTFVQQGGLSLRNSSNSFMNAQIGDIIPLAEVSGSNVEFSSKVFPPLPNGLGLQLIEQVGARGKNELAVEVIQVESTQFSGPEDEDLDNPPIDVVDFDADGDGKDEIAVLYGGWWGTVVVYSVSENGTPTPIAGFVGDVGNNPVGMDVADLNGDGYEDLLVANSTSATISILLSETKDGSLQFVESEINIPNEGSITCAAVIDWDGNADLDVVVGLDVTEPDDKDGYQILSDILNWQPGSNNEPVGACCFDGNCSDATFENCSVVSGTYQGDGTTCQDDEGTICNGVGGGGLWLEVPKYQLPDDSYLIDTPTCIDGGDQSDAWGFVGGTRYGRVHRGTSSGSLQVIAELGGYNTVTIEAIDLDDGGDDQLDLMVSSDEAESVYLFQGDNTEADDFGDLIPMAVSVPVDDMIAQDADSDGDMDLLLCASEAVTPLILLRNDGNSGLLPGGLRGRTWSKQTINVNYQIYAVTGGGLSTKDEEDDWDVGIGKRVSVRDEVEHVMHQTNLLIGETCAADMDGDGAVNVTELLMIIDQWGQSDSPADINDDGIVDVSDLLIVVGNWGPCE